MQNIVRTALGAQLQTCQLLGIPKLIKPNTTLNEKFDIHKDILPAPNEVPTVKYIGIGNGGHRMTGGTDGLAKPEPIQHTPTHTSLYKQLPFVLRKPDNDLKPEDRVKYRLRKLVNQDGVTYVAYYLRVLDLSQTSCSLELRSIKDGIVTSLPFNHTSDSLSPTPPAINQNGVITTTGEYVVSTAKVPFVMSEADIAEYLNVCEIMYGDDAYAMISEICICSGVDRSVTGMFNGQTSGYTDAIDVEIVNFISAFYALKFSTEQLRMWIEVGSAEALLNLQ